VFVVVAFVLLVVVEEGSRAGIVLLGTIVRLLSLHVHEEANDDSCEVVRSQVDLCNNSEEVLISQEALLQTLVQKV